METGWSKVTLSVRLDGCLDWAYINQAIADNPDLEAWESRDIKNPQESGVLCKKDRQSLSGKLSDKRVEKTEFER